jgi:hypothetical protein
MNKRKNEGRDKLHQAELDLAAVLTIPAIPIAVVREVVGKKWNEQEFARYFNGKTGLLAAGVTCWYLDDVVRFREYLDAKDQSPRRSW